MSESKWIAPRQITDVVNKRVPTVFSVSRDIPVLRNLTNNSNDVIKGPNQIPLNVMEKEEKGTDGVLQP